ncbi:MAG: hypothetical protein EOP56_14675 [Sphingobacteriales bacterium]|nr:MAG: hypothetical protein EOP56_14675 [Sphingobacteriales bacterium]
MGSTDCFSQTKRKSKTNKDAVIKKGADTSVRPQDKWPLKKRDTIVILVDSRGKETQIAGPKRVRPVMKDTVIILGKKRGATVDTSKKNVKIEMVNPECQCVTMKTNTSDTLGFESYINYSFSFKNNCKETVWVNSGYFTYLILNPNGTPVKVLRKLQYVKRYQYPEYVPLKPGATFDFRFGDDPFFEYDLRKGWKYKFIFLYNNKSVQRRTGKTYLCSELSEKIITVK